MNAKNRTHQIADLFVLCVLALIVIWYLFDAYSASSHIINLILVLPVGLLVLVLCGVELFGQVKGEEVEIEEPEPVLTVLPVMGLFIAYVVTLNWLGFDVGTALFVSIFLWLHGERRIHWALGYGIVFGFLVALFFSAMLPYPMPMLILPTEY